MSYYPPSYQAEQLKEQGNAHFKKGEYGKAEECYSQAITKNPINHLLWTNRANARLKQGKAREALDDCLRSVELHKENLKAYFLLAQAQLAVNHPAEALTSALTAYELCINSPVQTSSAATISALVLNCKRRKWEIRETERLRRRNSLLKQLEEHLEAKMANAIRELDERKASGELGEIGYKEERDAVEEEGKNAINDLRTAFSISDPQNMEKREVPDWLVDAITFEIMHDPVITKNGRSYERATIIEHLKRSPTDPLTREPLTIEELRPNLALRQACEEFLEHNKGWCYDW